MDTSSHADANVCPIIDFLPRMPFFVLLLPERIKLVLGGLVIANTLLLPLIFIWMMKKRGIISSYQMPERGERSFPFAVTGLFYFATWYMMNSLGLPGMYYLFVIGGAALIIIP
ncbi:MAG: hypothetical protein IPH20_15435 [Bacteroidales bacterium]|nr:hypothetical protein [Bacteroidales bacterium]